VRVGALGTSGVFGTAGPSGTPWRVQAAYPVYWACVQAAMNAAISDQGLASKDGAEATWGPVSNDRSGQYAMVAKFKNGKTVRSDFRCLPDTIQKRRHRKTLNKRNGGQNENVGVSGSFTFFVA
jgi:hypothetical protein